MDSHTETPPRAWGRPCWPVLVWLHRRNTPTGVGKTKPLLQTNGRVRKHPHGRGEDVGQQLKALIPVETPPRAWGRPTAGWAGSGSARNTPTGVGKTLSCALLRSCPQKHPHGRGEDNHRQQNPSDLIETPPRAWGRRIVFSKYINHLRNTPTGVGKT